MDPRQDPGTGRWAQPVDPAATSMEPKNGPGAEKATDVRSPGVPDMSVEPIDPQTPRLHRWAHLARHGRRLALAGAAVTSSGVLWRVWQVWWVSPPVSTTLLKAALAVALFALFALGRLIAQPRRLTAWLDELAEVPPAITKVIRTYRTEQPKWRRAPPRRRRRDGRPRGGSGTR